MHAEPETWAALLDHLVDATIAYLRAQVAAGAEAVQVFDSWVGGLSPLDYERRLWPRMRRLFEGIARARRARRSTSASARPGSSRLQASAGGDVIGLDWRIALSEGRRLVGRPRRPGEPRPDAAARARGRASRRRRAGSSTQNDRPPGPRLQPRPRRAARDGPRPPRAASSTSSTTTERPDDPRRRPADGLRQPRPPRPGRGVLHRHPPRHPARRPTCSRSSGPLPGDRRRVAAVADRGGAAGGARGRAGRARDADARVRRRCATSRRGSATSSGGMAADGVERFVAIALAPQRSSNAAGYRRAVDAGAGRARRRRPEVVFVESWHDQPRFIEALATTTREALARFADPAARPRHVHRPQPAGPRRRRGRPVPGRAGRAPRALVAERLGLERLRRSRSRAPAAPASRGSGPDILDEIRRLAAEGVTELVDPAGRLRRRPPRGPLRHRHRGAGRRPRRPGSTSSAPAR